MPLVSIIVACDPHGVIGKENKLPWRCKEDLQLFRKTTLNHAVIMGRKTWDSIPRKPLDNRANLVISRTRWDSRPDESIFFYGSIDVAIRSTKNAVKYSDMYGTHTNLSLKQYADKDIFIIGGAQTYKQALDMNLVDRIIMSTMNKVYDGDVKFPAIDRALWDVISTEEHEEFTLTVLDKKKR